MTSLEKALAWGLGIVTTGLVILGIYEETKSKPANSNTVTTTLTPGHRYSFQASCPTAFPALPPAGSTTAVAALLGLTGVSILTYLPAADGKSFTVTFDYTGLAMTLPPIQSGGATSCTSQLVDLGVSPSTGGTQQGGVASQGGLNLVNQGQLPAAQNLDLTSGSTGVAHATTNGALQVIAPWSIASVSPSPAYQGAAAISGNTARMVLTGTPALFDITGPPPASPIVTVRVQ
ncbi:MAG TPA: hypothetical protein VNV25_25600 [Gemmatimonadaceae bacterium]|nr:hypothetical protein [Gemmatimonadaceae bacterium]